MSDHDGAQNQNDGEDEDDMMKQAPPLPNDEEWDLSDSEFYNFFQGFDSSSAAPVDNNQGIIDVDNNQGIIDVDNNLPLPNNPTLDDPLSKKKKRQERNRDAALRSRERKKVYIKELEMKSNYFEEECKRLGMMLNCVAAENHALRLSLHTSKASHVSRTEQESAVLFSESLLLGSLLWFLGVICLLNLLEPLRLTREVPLGNTDNQNRGILAPRKTGSNILEVRVFQTLMRGKRCKASRTRMKLSFSFAKQALM